MMGERDPQKQLWSYQVNLDKRVRSDHPLRRINETLELDFVRREVAQFYDTKGNVSEDPVVIMKMMLLLFLDNVRSERELMRIVPERLDYMWFLGYGLDDTVPNHSVLSKARKRWGHEVFVALFSRVVAQCVRAGLIEGTKIHADSSLVDANSSLNSVRELDAATLNQIRQACREQTEKLEEADTKKNEADDDQDPDRPGPGPRTEISQKYKETRKKRGLTTAPTSDLDLLWSSQTLPSKFTSSTSCSSRLTRPFGGVCTCAATVASPRYTSCSRSHSIGATFTSIVS